MANKKAGVPAAPAAPATPTPKGAAPATPKPTPKPAPRAPDLRASNLSYSPAKMTSPIGGSAQAVLILVTILLIMAEWQSIVVPFASMLWNGKSSTTINWKSGLGLAVFAIIIVFLATLSDDMAGLMMIAVIGMMAVYMIEQKGGAFTAFFNWLQPSSSSSSSSSTPPVVKTGANPTGAAQ